MEEEQLEVESVGNFFSSSYQVMEGGIHSARC